MRRPQLLACLAVALGLGAVPAIPGHTAPSQPGKKIVRVRHLRTRLHSVREEMRQKRQAIRATKAKERHIGAEVHAVEDRINRTEAKLARVKSRLGELAAEKRELERRIARTEQRLEARKRVLARRLRDNYTRGRTSYVQVLLHSRSVHDYVSRSYYVQRIVESDTQLVRGIKADRRQLEADRRQLEAQAAETKALRADLEQTYSEYREDVAHKRELLEEVRENRVELEQALDELEQSSAEIEARIRALMTTPRGRARALRAWTGSFVRPADGPVTSGYGPRFHPILRRSRMHTGVDIGAGYGASIRAAASGEVIMAGYMRGYGNTVIVDHGGGVSTLYAHCSALLVSEGEEVSKGQTIARVGSTGLATGPHLHFEVRRNGTPVNPL